MAEWRAKTCRCIKATLPTSGRVVIRCDRHRGQPTKRRRLVCHFEDGIVRRG